MMVKYNRCGECLNTAILPVNDDRQAGGIKMVNFIEQEWNGYLIKIRPNDPFRALWAHFDLDWLLLYFNSSKIIFDLTVTVPNDDLHKDIEDTFGYEWVLCDGNNQPLQTKTLKGFSFFTPFGEGRFHFATNKKKAKALIKSGEMVKRGSNRQFIGVRKWLAITIGRLRANDYNIVMKFKSGGGAISEYMPMGNFTVFVRDRFIHAAWLGVIAVLAATLIALILRACEIPS